MPTPVTWEAVSALATLSSAVIVAVAAIAAVVQIRHLRTGNQLQAILMIYDRFNSEEMTLARKYCLEELPRMMADGSASVLLSGSGLDTRVTLVGNFLNEIGTLLIDGFIEERLVLPLAPVAARIWTIVAPLAQEWRRQRHDPVWADFEYVAAINERLTHARHLKRFPAWFRDRLRLEETTTEPAEAVAFPKTGS